MELIYKLHLLKFKNMKLAEKILKLSLMYGPIILTCIGSIGDSIEKFKEAKNTQPEKNN